MTHTIDPNAVATMQGRELDAAIAHWLFRRPAVYAWPDATFPFADIPAYSSDPAAFFAMVEAVREKGWNYKMWDGGHKRSHKVELFFTENGDVARRALGEASTLPLAFARAAVSACLSDDDTNQKGG